MERSVQSIGGACLASHLAGINASSTAKELEARFRATFDLWKAQRTRERIREAVRVRGDQLCELRDRRALVPRYATRARRITVCGETYRVAKGGNSTGVRYAWHDANEWVKATLRKHGASESLTREIMEWWNNYPHRALRALERRRFA